MPRTRAKVQISEVPVLVGLMNGWCMQKRGHSSVCSQRRQKPVDWILGSAGSLSLPSAEPSDGVRDTEAEEQSSESLAVDARRLCSSFSWACSTSCRCRSLVIKPSIVWKISSTFLITWLWGAVSDWPVWFSCSSGVASDWLPSGSQAGASWFVCGADDITSCSSGGKCVAIGVGGSARSSVALSPWSDGITR